MFMKFCGCVKLLFHIVLRELYYFWVRVKHFLLRPYYHGLSIQARYLYRRSDLFKLRWEQLGHEYALESFEGDTALYFFGLAKKEHWRIRLQIFIDATVGREPKPYFISQREE